MHTKLTEQFIIEACELLRAGNFVCVVTDYMNIAEKTWYYWIKVAKAAEKKEEEGVALTEEDIRCLKLLRESKKAQSQSIVRNVAIIQKAAPTSWQAAAWYLERTKPDLYAANQKITISDNTEPLNYDDVRAKLAELRGKKEQSNTPESIEQIEPEE